MKWIAPALALVVLIALVVFPLDYGFYHPTQGLAAAGRPETPVDPHEREVLQFTLTEADVARFQGKATLAALSDLYGTKDSLRCSVMRTYTNDNLAAANWKIEPGTPVTLCLN
jgi:hypothetical protein